LKVVAEMDRVWSKHGTDLATAALQASVSDSRISTTVIGLSSPKRLDSLLVSLHTDLPDTLFEELASLMPAREHWLDLRQD
jgi:D-threo-aldose 1-dehydrogenase